MFEIGNSLREARMRQRLDFSQVELATKIRAKYLRALEEEQFEIMPTGTYIKGFLRAYADYLGLDGQLYVDEYNSRYLAEHFDDMPQRRPRLRQERTVERRGVVLALAGIAAVTALVIVAWRFGGGGSSPPAPVTQTRQQKPTAPAGLRFVGRGKGTYLEVRRSSKIGAVLFQGTLAAGDRQFVPGTRFWLLVRRPSGVRFSLAGKPVALPLHRNLKVVVTPTRTDRVSG